MQEIIQFISNHPILSVIWIILFSIIIFTFFKSYFSKIKKVSNDEAIQLINKEDAVVIDLRNQNDYRNGHITNSLNLTMQEIKSGNLCKLNKIKKKSIIIVCTNGITSNNSAQYLIDAGFEHIYVLKEGIYGWNQKNLPLFRSK